MSQTVLVTGAGGFIAKHIVLQLLLAGHRVVGSVRAAERCDEIRAAVAPHLPEGFDLDAKLGFCLLDLTQDDGWAEALEGCTALMHTASPFPLRQPETEDDLIRPAVEGTLRALTAAHEAGIKRVVLTSSAVAIMQGKPPKNRTFDETDWSEPDHPTNTPYGRSKLQAEHAAWEYVAGTKIALTTINPVLVLGAPLDGRYGASVSIVQRLMRGTDRVLPRIGFPIVDVRDVAAMHVKALENRETHGMRILATAGFLWFHQIAETLAETYPDRPIKTRVAPNFVIKLVAKFNAEARAVLPLLDVMPSVSNNRARKVLDQKFTTPRDAVRATAAYLVKEDAV